MSLSYLEDCQQALVERVKVSPGLLRRRVEVEPGPEDLHAEQGEDAHEEEEQEQQGGNGLDAVGQ